MYFIYYLLCTHEFCTYCQRTNNRNNYGTCTCTVRASGQFQFYHTVGCSGRKNIISVGAPRLLTNSECGSVILSSAVLMKFEVTMPPTPLANCEFTFEPGTQGFFVNFFGQHANLPAYGNNVTEWNISSVPDFRSDNEAVTLQFDGTEWKQSGFSSPIYITAEQPKNAAQLTHGQVHFNWNSTTSQFNLCRNGGAGGLIVDGAMRQLLENCLTLVQSGPMPGVLNYFYAVRVAADDIIVSDVQVVSGKIRLTVNSSRGNVNDTVLVYCVNIAGAIQANVMDTATVVNGTTLELQTTPSTGLGMYTHGGDCQIVRLAVTQTGHVTGNNGVEVWSGDAHYTLVGMCYVQSDGSVSDTSTERDCASWFNRGLKTCSNKLTTDHTTTSTVSYVEVGSEIECGFVTWGIGDPANPSDLAWSASGTMSNSTGGDGAAATAGFDLPSAAPPPIEQTGAINAFNPVNGFSFSVRGSKSGLTEGRHVITLLGKAINGGIAKYFGTVPPTSLEISIPQ